MTRAGNARAPKRGEIWDANLGALDTAQGAEMQKTRPVLIVGKNLVNEHRRTVLVIPLATSGANAKANPPVSVQVECGQKKAAAVIDQLRALDKSRLLRFIDVASPADLESIAGALRQVLEL